MQRLPSVIPVLCAALVVGITTVRAESVGTSYKVVKSGVVAPMGFHYEVGQDCRSLGQVSMNVIEPPRNGEVFVASKRGHVELGALSPEGHCNSKPIQGVEVYYRSAPGFQGQDSYTIERVFPKGNAQLFKINVSVR